MKYCENCGTELNDLDKFCPSCGHEVLHGTLNQEEKVVNTSSSKGDGLKLASKVLMIISTVVFGIYIIPLAWCLPMTISFCGKVKRGEPISIGFKICTLLFLNTIAGILLLIDSD